MSTTIAHIPNPYTPMAWVPPHIARRLTIQLHGAAGALAILVWDILLHIPQDYTMLTKNKKRLNLSSSVYIIARLSGLAHVLSLVIVQSAPIGNCDYIRRVSFLYSIALPSTTLLLVFRVVALYKNNKYVVAFFTLCWLAVLALSIVVPMGTTGMQIKNTPYCVQLNFKPYAIIGAIAPAVHDALIFVATAWAFLRNSYMEPNLKNSYNVIVLGKHLPAFSKSLLRDGQLYILATVIFNILFAASYLTPQSFITPCTFTLPTFVLINTMSCHLYRNVRLGLYRDGTVNTEVLQRALEGSSFSDPHQMGIAFSPRRLRHSTMLTQEIDLEAAREDSNFSNREKVDVIVLDKAQGRSRGFEGEPVLEV